MDQDVIKIRGARVHNLKNINVDIPKNKLVVITGLSGSGKSSLAFDTLYAEGQRRYVESLSPYARQFLGIMDKPDVDKIEGISPAISIDQRRSSHNPRSTVGTITEIYDYLRLLYARIGKPHCPNCKKPIARQTVDQIVAKIMELPKGSEIVVLGPVVRDKKGEHKAVIEEIQRAGFARVRVDGIMWPISEALQSRSQSDRGSSMVSPSGLDKNKKHKIEAVVDQLILDKLLDRSRLVDSLETALKLGKGIVVVQNFERPKTSKRFKIYIFSEHFACPNCGVSLPELEPRMFSFNNPYGACVECTGLGQKLEVDPALVMPNKNLTIAQGAIWPWANASHKIGRQGVYYWKLQGLAEELKFSLDEPVGNLSAEIINAILHGKGDWEGVIPNLERRYHETDSEWTRQEIEQYMVVKKCERCQGKRLKPEVLAVTVAQKSINQVVEMPIGRLTSFFEHVQKDISAADLKISQGAIKEIVGRVKFLVDVGLDYLNLDRRTSTLAGGEEQRIRLATQIGSGLSGVLYILDEPSIGLHARDQNRLIKTLLALRDLGNTVVVVEHDPQTMLAADWIVDIGPGAGKNGGRVVFEGTPREILKSNTLTGQYLSGKKTIYEQVIGNHKSVAGNDAPYQKPEQNYLTVIGAREHNLKNIDVNFPLGKFICVTGVSGSGKSSLVSDILARALLQKFYRAKEEPGAHKEIVGLENINKVVLIDQSPIGRTPRSNPATYTGAFAHIRDLFAETHEAKVRGYGPGRFSFNVKGGRCEACEGQGVKKVEMYFLPDIYVECEECHGRRYSKEALEVLYKGKNIAQVLDMTIDEAAEFFRHIPGVYAKMKTLREVGLGYVKLGQAATSLSGGEAQRIKLASELSRRDTGKTLYMLDEPTTGLHFEDVRKLVAVLRSLVEKGNTVVTIEHSPDFIRCVDWIVDLGPEGGEGGGRVIAEGPPAQIAKVKESHTGRYLKK